MIAPVIPAPRVIPRPVSFPRKRKSSDLKSLILNQGKTGYFRKMAVPLG